MAFKPTPFKVAFSDAQLAQLQDQLRTAHIARPTFESSEAAQGRFGVRRDWVLEAKARWENEFDWRKQEARINTFPQFIAPVTLPSTSLTINLHFVHVAATVPQSEARTILLIHGWPGSFLEFLNLIEILGKTGKYNIVAPSSPGYTFSDAPPVDREFSKIEVAESFQVLMEGLGYTKYTIQAGDWGSTIARILAVKNPSSVSSVHLNFIPVPIAPEGFKGEDLNAEEKEGVARALEFLANGRGYSEEHRTRPATIAFAVSSSPIALLSWVGEKFISWTDVDPPLDEILTSLTVWLLTDTFPTSIYCYRDAAVTHTDPAWYIHQPTAFSSFAKEIVPAPRAWAATVVNLKWYKYHAKGGHFAALEQPEALAEDIEEFLDEVWPVRAA